MTHENNGDAGALEAHGDTSRVLTMNTANAEDWDRVPFPARQQLGDPDALAHKFNLAERSELGDPDQGGHGVMQVENRVHFSQPVLSPAETEEPEEYGRSALQREVPGRNARTISGSQSSSAPRDGEPSRTTSATRSSTARDVGSVPDGSVQDVLDWVGDDPERARAALEIENQRQSPRKSLLVQLNEKI